MIPLVPYINNSDELYNILRKMVFGKNRTRICSLFVSALT